MQEKNGYINESIQKAGFQKMPSCIEHAYSIWSTTQEAKNNFKVFSGSLKN